MKTIEEIRNALRRIWVDRSVIPNDYTAVADAIDELEQARERIEELEKRLEHVRSVGGRSIDDLRADIDFVADALPPVEHVRTDRLWDAVTELSEARRRIEELEKIKRGGVTLAALDLVTEQKPRIASLEDKLKEAKKRCDKCHGARAYVVHSSPFKAVEVEYSYCAPLYDDSPAPEVAPKEQTPDEMLRRFEASKSDLERAELAAEHWERQCNELCAENERLKREIAKARIATSNAKEWLDWDDSSDPQRKTNE